jgi:hypothetical protein
MATVTRFGRWLVVLATGRRYACVCSCGRRRSVLVKDLRSGRSRSCGCLRGEQVSRRNRTNPPGRSHGMSYSREYRSWSSMIQRCTNPKAHKFELYGGRGIRVCARWLKSFAAFYDDMGPRPSGTTLDRKNNDGNYEPLNCRWATQADQCRNSRRWK